MPLANRAIRISLAAAVACASSTAWAADFYKGKTITVVVGFSPGGGYDAYARALARHLSAHVPGNPRVIVQNMPGAGSLVAARSLNATQATDGTVLATFNSGLVTQSAIEPAKIGLDVGKLSWIGIVTPDFRVCYGYGPKGVKSWSDLMSRKQFVLGSTGKGSGNYINGATLREVFHAPIKQVLGFPGSAEMRLAIERGELDGDCGTFSSIPIDWIRDKKAHPFVRFTKSKSADMPSSAKYIDDFAKTKDQKTLLAFLDSENEIGRSFVVSKKVPADRIAILRKAFDATMKDPAYLADMKKQRLPVHPVEGKDARPIINHISKASKKTIDEARKIYE